MASNAGSDGSMQIQPTSDPAANAAAARNGPEGQAAPEQSTAEKIMSFIRTFAMRGMMIYFIMSFFKRSPTTTTAPGAAQPGVKSPATNLFNAGQIMDLYVYVSQSIDSVDFGDPDSLIWVQKDLEYGDWYSGPNGDATYTSFKEIRATEHVQNNGSIYIHAFVVKSGKSPDPEAGKGKYAKNWTVHKARQLNKYRKKSFKKTVNLITGETETSAEDQAKIAEGIKSEVVSHWHPNITINIVNDFTAWPPGGVPPPLDEFVEFTPSLTNYKPILYLNDYWNLQRDYMPINNTVKTLNLTVIFQPLSLFKWQMYSAQQMRNRLNPVGAWLQGDEEEEDQDSIKEAFLETNPYLLGLTFVVSIVHSIFEFLAFKNDIQFWNNRKSLEGLSVRSVFFNVFQSLVVLLYVLDNETNTVIVISCFVGLGIEIWKINKVTDVSVDFENKILGFIPRLVFKDKGSYEESGTKEFDRMAFKYLGLALWPLAIAYCVYSVIYNEHKSWYSFVLSSCYGFLLTFGFIMMTPQLFINYKLKSVAHLPWRMLTYKALNTFIDDIFAFVIRMPTMYRIGCFRDDIVFLIMCYQRYIYKVDHSRVNEFGFSGDMLEEAERKKAGEAQAITTGPSQNNGDTDKSPMAKKAD